MRYRVCRVGLEDQNLVSCGGGLETSFVGDGDGCIYVGVGVSLGRVIAE